MKSILSITMICFLLQADARMQAENRYVPISIPTRDGKTLAADLYTNDSTAAKPVILIQTPYNKNYYRLSVGLPLPAGTPFPYDSARYNYVVLDWRGFYGSKDAAVQNYDRGLDGYDAVEWIAVQAWCNGKVGTWGPSALGFIQFLTAQQHPPHLVCSVPLVKDFKTKYTDYFYGGVYRKEHVETLERLGFLSTSLILAQPDYTLVWKTVERNSDDPESIAVPMLLISGWFDHFPDDVLRAFDDLRQRSNASVRDLHKLIMGPWLHSGVGLADQGELSFPNAVAIPDDEALRFFQLYLRDVPNGYDRNPAVMYYQMGADEWRGTTRWTDLPRRQDTMYFHDDRSLSHAPPASPAGAVTLLYDPRDPSPSCGGARFNPFDPTAAPGPLDIRQTVESRPDALVFTTAAFEKDYEINGPVQALLRVSTDRTDTDMSIRLCDVYPDGRSMIMTDGIRRLRFRDGYEREAIATPGAVYPLAVELQHLALTLPAGHRLRVVVSSSDYPRFDLNLNNGGAMYTAGDTLVATNTLHMNTQNPSALVLSTAPLTTEAAGAEESATAFTLDCWPNPVRESAQFSFRLPAAGMVRLSVYDIRGRIVAVAADGYAEAGGHTALFPTAALAPGMYLAVLRAGGRVTTQSIAVY